MVLLARISETSCRLSLGYHARMKVSEIQTKNYVFLFLYIYILNTRKTLDLIIVGQNNAVSVVTRYSILVMITNCSLSKRVKRQRNLNKAVLRILLQ